MKSICCSEALVISFQEELYHGSDDEYELVIPYHVCTCCGEIQLIVGEQNHLTEEKKDERNFSNTDYKDSKRTLYASSL